MIRESIYRGKDRKDMIKNISPTSSMWIRRPPPRKRSEIPCIPAPAAGWPQRGFPAAATAPVR